MLKDITVLVTGGGSPGIIGTIYSLKQNFEKRNIRIITTDVNSNVIGKYYSDKFYTIPHSIHKELYLSTIREICKNEHVDVMLPQNTLELLTLSQLRNEFKTDGVSVVVSSFNSVSKANDKFETLNAAREIGLPVTKCFTVNTSEQLKDCALKLGWPVKKFVVKPIVSNGSRGMRIITEDFDKKKSFYNDKPNNVYSTLEDLINILGNQFPTLMLTDYLPGDEYTVDLFRSSKAILAIPRKRNRIFAGITFEGTTVKHDEIISYSEKLAEKLDLTFCFGFQYKMDENDVPKILECNPRVQGSMIMATNSGANIIYMSVKEALGEDFSIPEINWNSSFIRYWGGLGLAEGTINLQL